MLIVECDLCSVAINIYVSIISFWLSTSLPGKPGNPSFPLNPGIPGSPLKYIALIAIRFCTKGHLFAREGPEFREDLQHLKKLLRNIIVAPFNGDI